MTKRLFFFGYYYCCKSWKQVSLFVPFRSDIYGPIIWHHWINLAESQELCTATTAQIVCLNSHSERFAFLNKALWESCTLERNDVQLNAMWAMNPQLLWKRFRKLAIVMFYCNFCKCILELKCVFYKHDLYSFLQRPQFYKAAISSVFTLMSE